METKTSIRTCIKADKNWKIIIKDLFLRFNNIFCVTNFMGDINQNADVVQKTYILII